MAYLIDLGGGGKVTRKAALLKLDGQRVKIALGRVTADVGRRFCSRLDELAGVRALRERPGGDLAEWVGSLSPAMRERFAEVGLIDAPAKRAAITLSTMLEEVFQSITVRDQTRVVYTQTRTALEKAMGAATPLQSIGPMEAERFRRGLVESGLAEATISKRIKTARAFFKLGVRWKMISENPFDGMKAGSQTNRARMMFVPAEWIAKVVEQANTLEWKALIILARFCGLRTPSEHFTLRWADVDFAGRTLIVHSPKTSGKAGREYRVVPMFAEGEAVLLALMDAAPEGAEYVFSELRRPGVNLRTQFDRFVKRAGLASWPRAFQNLRASRATELAAGFPAHVEAAWLGHTEAVAKAHYLQVRDQDFAAAAALPNTLAGCAFGVQTGADKGCQAATGAKLESSQGCGWQPVATHAATGQIRPMTPMGFEPSPESRGIRGVRDGGGADWGTSEGDLCRLAEVWATLPDAVREEILRLAGVDRGADRQTARPPRGEGLAEEVCDG